MPKPNHLEIYKLLEKSNCRQCAQPTCLAFAAAVLRGEASLDRCPHLDRGIVEELNARLGPSQRTDSEDWEKALEALQSQFREADLASLARRLGASLCGDKLAVKCLGKDFYIGPNGGIASDCHKNRWLAIPLLNYVLHGSGLEPTGHWLHFGELKGGATWNRLFAQRCEKPLKQLVDHHTDLFEIIMDIFDGKTTEDDFSSDISVVIHPLPKLPVLICYWKQEGAFESTLSLFFDSTASDNLKIESIYTLGVGLLTMFEKIALTHDQAK